MNKQVSVQYAYKKDGKGERHGDTAERLLASEAKKNMTQPVAPPLPVQLFTQAPPAPVAMPDPGPRSMMSQNAIPGPPPFINGRPGMNYTSIPPLAQQRPPPQPPSMSVPAPAGLPPRPPPSQVGYGGGGPQSFLPPGFKVPSSPAFPAPGPPPGLPPGFHAAR